MKQSDKLRNQWITEYGPIYGPYPCYDKWAVRAGAVAVLMFVALLGWCS